jgi:hypothetical protein
MFNFVQIHGAKTFERRNSKPRVKTNKRASERAEGII